MKEIIKKLRKEQKSLMREVSKHRCRAKTGNWCLDCEINHATAQGIQFAINLLEGA